MKNIKACDYEIKKARPYWVTDSTHEAFKEICKSEAITMEGMFRNLLEEYKKSKEGK